jgi:hypothetical protein
MKRTLIFLAIVMLLLTACSAGKKTLGDEILGTWVNDSGYSIQFQPSGIGFIPGVKGKIPDSNFVYTIIDDSHIMIDLQGQKQTIGIVIEGDQMTWKDSLGDVPYTRVK